ncbi:hypothetical protein LAZ67_1004996, partial [Cordylochernes scorpioides]
MNVENFDALKDLSVTNQLKKKVPNVLRNHLIDDWTKLNNPDELADKLDEYENVRTEMGPPHWNAKHLIPPSFQQKSARFPNQSEVKETKQGTNVSGQDAARNEISETYPNTLRRMVNRTIRNDKGEPKCFNCNQFGHIARDCPAPRTTLTCRGCGQTGHKERNCTRPKEGLKVANLEVEGLETVPPDVYLKDVKIDNKETVKAMIDTGSSSCLMRESVARRISVDIEPDSTSLYGIGNQTAPAARTVGKTTVDLEIDGVVGKEIAVFIVNDDAQPYDLLIGRTWTDLPYVSFARIGKELHIGYSSEFPFANLQEEIKSRRIELRATETVQLESDSINFTSAITDEVKDGYVLFTGVDDACVDSLLEVVDGKTTVPIISAGKGKLRVRKNQCVGRVELLNLDDIVVNLDVAEDSFQTKNEEKREGQDQMKRKRPILPEDINVNHSLTSKERQEILDVVNEYRDCFALGMEELGCTDVTKMDIKEVDGSKPVCLRPYKTTASEREAIREIVREWKDNGIVTETRSPYASPVLLVRKKTGDHRLVVDYRRLNTQTVKDKFPLPRIDDLLEGLRNAKFFTTLDLAHGYLQIPLTDKAKLKTAFITPDDTGQFERMIFGLANAPAEFQRLMHTVLGPLLNKKAFCYLDDVIIPAKDWREMIERLREVLERIRSAKLTLKPSKCEFGRREVEFLGYVISTGGLKPGPRKIKAIEEFPEPKNVHDIQRFLGLTNFFRRFVKDFARKAEPLSRLTKKGSQFEWKEEQRRSFGGLRKDLVEYPVLAHYNPELKTEVHCDASAEGLAGMVLQMDEDGKWRLVYCVSKKTTEAEKMYHSSKLELMAIVWTLDRLRQFLVGIKFTVVTDCQALVYMNAKKTTNPQIARWYNLIQEYDFEIRHKPGEKMAHVDGMSRAPVDDPRDTMEEIVEKNLEVCLTITLEEQILMIQHSDPELRDLIQIFRKDPCDRTVGEQNRINDSATEESPDEEPEVEDTPRRNPRRSCNARFNRGRLKSRNGRIICGYWSNSINNQLAIVQANPSSTSTKFRHSHQPSGWCYQDMWKPSDQDVKDKTIYTKFDGLQNPILVNHLEKIREHELKKLLEHNRNVFCQHAIDLGKVAIQHKIITKSEQPISLRPYRRPLKEYEEIAEQVKELLEHKLIRISDSPWAFPVVMVPKKDGNKRMCIDYRRLNEITLDDRQPLPHIQDIFDRLHGSRFFSTLDVAWGYWQIEMDPQSIQKTAFVTNDGHYEFLVMPFGLKNAASTFQRIIQHILGELLWKGTCSFQDDILVYTKTWQEHIELLSKVFDKLRQYNMKFKLSKCIFGRTEVKYLGHIISHNQLKPDPGKVKSIQDFPRPDTVKKVRQFMGLANYYRKFVKDFSKISFPLVRLTRKNQPFIWNEEVEESFAKLKMALSTKPVLAIYNPDYPSKVYTDASKYGIGAILTQIGPDNEEHVIAYYSKTLQPHQENYSAYEMECLAVIQATDHFHVYIENQPFEIITDHAALQWLFTMKKPKPKYFRWILSLSSKSCNIVHRSGKQQTHVDALSRLPVVNIATQELQEHQQNSDLSFLKNSHTHDGV